MRISVLGFALALLSGLALATSPPGPARYQSAESSTLGFSSSYDDESFEGTFSQFSADIAFDPATVSGRFEVVIKLASAGTENEERDEVLLAGEFFNVMAMPEARYSATRFRKLDDGRFVAEGTLTLRGITQPVALTFTWTPGERPVLQGTASVNRLGFEVGMGDWDDTEVMPDAVAVSTRLALQPAG
jgi:polyisoprenoid-binding protein YceI